MITGYIKGQNLTIRTPMIAADTIDYLTAQFVFQTVDWEGCRLFSHWKCGETNYTIELSDAGKIEKEQHLNLTAGTWTVWIHGERYRDGELIQRITTDEATLTVTATGTAGGSPFPEVPASDLERINAEIAELQDAKLSPVTADANMTKPVGRTEDGQLMTAPDVFWAEYGATKYAEVRAAVDAGKLCVVQKVEERYALTRNALSTQRFWEFGGIDVAQKQVQIRLYEDGTWTDSRTHKLISSMDVVLGVNEESTDKEIPTAKATYDAILKYGGNSDSGGGATPNEMIVTITRTGSTYVADKTFDEIGAAIAGGKRVIATSEGLWYETYSITTADSNVIKYKFVQVTTNVVAWFDINSDNTVKKGSKPLNQGMTGATDSADGLPGIVPAPLKGQQDYILHGDGTWREIDTQGIPEQEEQINGKVMIVLSGVYPDAVKLESVSPPTGVTEIDDIVDMIAAGDVIIVLVLTTEDGDCMTAATFIQYYAENGQVMAFADIVTSTYIATTLFQISMNTTDPVVVEQLSVMDAGESSVYWVTYGQTTFAEVKAAEEAGKYCVLNNVGRYCPITKEASTSGWYSFFNLDHLGNYVMYRVGTDDEWTEYTEVMLTSGSITYSVGAESSNQKIPSALAVYDAIASNNASYYTKHEIDSIMGSYVTDIADLIGGEAHDS